MTTRDIKADYLAKGDGQEVTTAVTIGIGSTTLTVGSNLFVTGDVGKQIFIQDAGDSVNASNAPTTTHATVIDSVPVSPGNTVILHDPATRALSAAARIVTWGTDDAAKFMQFNSDFQGQTGVVLTVPASSGFYCIWTGATTFCSGIKQVTVTGDVSQPVLSTQGGNMYPGTLGCGSILSFIGAGHFAVGAKINTVAAGSNFVTCKTPSEAGGFGVGDWVLLSAYETQFSGYPPNPAFFEYKQVANSNSSTGVVTFTSNVVDSRYLETYPGASMDLNPGRARIDRMGGDSSPPLWDTDCTWENLHIIMPIQMNFIGRRITLNNCIMETGVNPTCCGTVTVNNNTWTEGAEFDKCNEVVTINGGDYSFIHVQSSGSAKQLTINNSAIGILSGTSQNTTVNNCSITRGFAMGSTGFNETLVMTDCTISGPVNPYVPIVISNVAASQGVMSGGTITATSDHGSWVRTLVPGNTILVCSEGSNPDIYGPAFRVTSCSGADPAFAVDPIYFGTTFTGGWPAVPLGAVSIVKQPVASVTFTNTHGDVFVEQLTGSPPGRPPYSYLKRTYNRNTLTGFADIFFLFGRITSLVVNVIEPYTGSIPLDFAPFYGGGDNEPVVLIDGTRTTYFPHFDLKTRGKRTITPEGVFNDQGVNGGAGKLGADNDHLALPQPYTWMYNSTNGRISSDVSGDPNAVNLLYYWEIILDQSPLGVEAPAVVYRYSSFSM